MDTYRDKKRPTKERVFHQRTQDFKKNTRECVNENCIAGRNAVRELLAGGRDIDKIYIQTGEREGSIRQLIGIASERKIPLIEADKNKLFELCGTQAHQDIVALAA